MSETLIVAMSFAAFLFAKSKKRSRPIETYGRSYRTMSGVLLTSYNIAKLRLGNSHPLYATNGQLIATITSDSYDELTMQGSGKLPDGRVVGYVDGTHWRVGAYATGAAGKKLVAHESIAVDPLVIPYGSIVYIVERGLWCFADDTGGGITGGHIDLFTGDKRESIKEHVNIAIFDNK